jgi:hypothetical protein
MYLGIVLLERNFIGFQKLLQLVQENGTLHLYKGSLKICDVIQDHFFLALLEDLHCSTIEATSGRCWETVRDILDPSLAIVIVVHVFVEDFGFEFHAIVFQNA